MSKQTETKTHLKKPAQCAGCGYVTDRVTIFSNVGTKTIKPGDVTLCAKCGVYLIYTDDMDLRLVTANEWMSMPPLYREHLARLREEVAKRQLTNNDDTPGDRHEPQ